MFQFYEEKINPNDESFIRFVSEYLEKNDVDVENISYGDLYTHIRKAIRQFLHVQNRGGEKRRNDKQS